MKTLRTRLIEGVYLWLMDKSCKIYIAVDIPRFNQHGGTMSTLVIEDIASAVNSNIAILNISPKATGIVKISDDNVLIAQCQFGGFDCLCRIPMASIAAIYDNQNPADGMEFPYPMLGDENTAISEHSDKPKKERTSRHLKVVE